jgi:hypothetical protein
MDKRHDQIAENKSLSELKVQRGPIIKEDSSKKQDLKAFVESFFANQANARAAKAQKKAATAQKNPVK